jgi:hypothetical protein
LKSGSLNLLETSGPVQACNGIDLPFIFLLCIPGGPFISDFRFLLSMRAACPVYIFNLIGHPNNILLRAAEIVKPFVPRTCSKIRELKKSKAAILIKYTLCLFGCHVFGFGRFDDVSGRFVDILTKLLLDLSVVVSLSEEYLFSKTRDVVLFYVVVNPCLTPVFFNRRAAARHRALASIIPGRERFSWKLSF